MNMSDEGQQVQESAAWNWMIFSDMAVSISS
jgi:hypothetical protein